MASLPLWAGALGLARAGWAPTGDEAVISWRAWDVLAGNAPLVGQFTQAGVHSKQAVFDPGPLLYWVMAIPTHVAPGFGPVVGVMLFDTLALIAACSAAAHIGSRTTAVLVAGGSALGALALLNYLVGAPVWNPHAGLVPFGALLVVAWATAAGRLGWWPVSVVLASYVTQAHLMFAPAAIALCVISPVLGLVAGRRAQLTRRWRWPWVGVAAFAVCWAAPLWQEITGHPGNLSLLSRAVFHHHGATVGWQTALAELGGVTLPDPIWLHAPHLGSSNLLVNARGSVPWAVTALVALVLVAVWATWTNRPRTFGLAVVALAADLGACWAIAGIAASQAMAVFYIQYVLWPAGLVTIFSLGFPLATTTFPWVRSLVLRRGDAPVVRRALGHRARNPAFLAFAAVVGLLCVGVAAISLDHAAEAAQLRHGESRRLAIDSGHTMAASVGRPQHRGERVRVSTDASTGLLGVTTVMAAAYELRQAGWTPSVDPPWEEVLAPGYHRRSTDPVLWLTAERPAPEAIPLGTVERPGDDGPSRATIWIDPVLVRPG